MRSAFIRELLAAAETRSDLWLVTGDLGYSVLEPFAERHPDRYLNAGVAEQNMVGVAAGLAAAGATVVVYSIANFPTFRALEQVRNDVAYPGARVIIVSVGSGFSYGSHGSTHHAIEDLAVMRSLPNLTIVSPCDPVEAAGATKALLELGGPAYLRLGKAGERIYESVVDDPFVVGRIRCIRPGEDVTILAVGSILGVADEAATRLEADGLSVRVLSAHTLRPFDVETLSTALDETSGVVTLEEHRAQGGLMSVVAESLLANRMPTSAVRSLAVPSDLLLGTGDQAFLRSQAGIGVDSVVAAARDLLDQD
jgi:transketolase